MMRNFINTILKSKLCKSIFVLVIVCLSLTNVSAQTQPPSIDTGVTFQWDGPQPTNNDPANLLSITVGANVYNQFIFPTGYTLTQLGPGGDAQNRVRQNGVNIETTSASPTWNASALSAFSSSNMNFKFESTGNGRNICNDFVAASTTDSQIQTLSFGSVQVVNQGALIGITERNANNCFYIEVIGSLTIGGPEVLLGNFFVRQRPLISGPNFSPPPTGSDYWGSGRVNSNGGTIGIALFRLDQIAPLGSFVSSLRLIAATGDHGDGKVFLLRTLSSDLGIDKEVDNLTPNVGDVVTFTITASNFGSSSNTGVQVQDLLPSGYTYQSHTVSSGTYNVSTGLWDIGNLAVLDDQILTITALVNATGVYTNTATISGSLEDPNLVNNTDSVTCVPNVNVPPVANDDTNATIPSTAGATPINALTASDTDGTIATYTVSTLPSNGTLFVGGVAVTAGQVLTPAQVATLTYDPSGTFVGNDTFTFTATDNNGAIDATPATITIPIGNNPPVANDDTNATIPSTAGATPINALTASDTDGTIATYTVSTLPSNGTLFVGGVAVTAGQVLTPAQVATLTYDPNLGFNGNDTFTFTATDNNGGIDATPATITIPVVAIDAVNDTPTPINGTPGGTTPSVLANDTLNGSPLVPTDVTLTPTSVPAGLTLNPDGTITVDPNTPAGTYPVVYTICEIAVPTNCDTATASVVVDPAPIDAIVDDYTAAPINGTDGGSTASVLVNDTLNSVLVNPADITLTPVTVPAGLTLNPDGTITVAPGTPASTYVVEYTICENLNPTNCDTTTATVLVIPAPIDAVDDTPASIASAPGGTTPSVLLNDTLNGVILTPTDVALTPVSVPAGLTLNPDGTITVAPGTPSGTYPVVYQICEVLNPTNCDTATANVVVAAIDAVDDTPAPINGLDGGNTPSVLVNDTLNGSPVNPTDVTLTPVTVPAGLTLNPDGTITVPAGTPAGTYPVVYQICEIAVPTNCDTATASVVVDPAPIDAVIDDYTAAPINGTDGGSTPSVLVNDTLNSILVNPADITLTPVTVPAGLTLNPDGTITVAPGTPASTYVVEYTICENLNPTNCDTTTATVLVTPAPIDAIDDTPASIASAPGGTTPSVLLNDTLNGIILTPADVALTPVSVPAGLTLNPDGTITVAPGTPNGTYPVVYQICEVLNPTNCDTATASVVVAAIDAVDDTPAPINGLDGGNTPSVLVNDTLNGSPVVPGDITLTPVTVPGGLTLNPDGTITVPPGTPAGTYPVVYQICEIAVPTNCDTATASVVVDPAPIDAIVDDYTATPINGTDGGTTPTSVLVNDTLNGLPVVSGDITLTPVTVPAGLTLNADGTITVAPNTPASTYVVEYTICENLNPTNCDTTTATVLVTPAPIDAIDDTPASIASAPGGTTPSVLLNDTLNGVILTPADVALTPVSVPAGLTLNPDGTITVAPGTPNGTYPVVYQICEVLNPTNCDTATASVVVAAIDAVDDTPAPINGLDGGNTPSVLVNDTLNGSPVVPGDITLTPVTVPGGLTLNPDGTITVPPGTPAGTYPVVYQICEIAVPTNCDTATASVVVDPAPIDAIVDDYTATPINGTDGGTTPTSVLVNDTLNGLPVVPGDITLTPVTVPAGLTLNADGTITVAPNTPASTYVVEYTICENLNPTNCDTTTATVLVTPAPIDAIDDTPASIASAPGGTTPSVLLNDTLNGVILTPADVALTPVSVPAGLTLNPDGTITVAPGTPNGTYPVVYQICEVLNPTNCDTATASVVVAAIDAVDDTPAPINGLDGGNTPSVLVNDTLNGSPVVPGDITLTPVTVPGGLTLNPDGTITVPPGTPAGTYPVVYQICEIAVPTNCDTATASVVVDPAPIDAIVDDYTATPINGTDGGTTPTSVLVNDTLNGLPVVSGDITLTPVTVPAGLTLNADGTITVAPNTPASTYVVEYTICENLNPTNCDTTTATVLVTPAPIDAIDDTPASIASAPGGTTPSVLLNDTLNGVILTPADVALTPVSVPAGLTLNPDGTITVAPGTPSGTYPVVYQICEVLNPANCDTATASVVVAAIDAVDDTPAPINGLDGGNTPSVLVNDTLNGSPVVPGDITLTPVTVPGGLTLNPDGTITVPPGTPAGTYPVVYQICEIAVPTNCDTATASVVVDPAPIDAIVDDYTATPINGTDGGTTPTSVLVNDTLNGLPVVSGDITLTPVTVPAGLTLNADGTITVAPNTPASTYVVEYTICENLNPTNCDTTTATVLVTPAPIDAIDDTPASIASAPGGTTPSVLLNDTLNGVILTPADVALTPVSVPAGLTLNPDGTITVAPGTPSGTYPVVYQICEVLNPTNCDTATASVVVVAIDAIDDTLGPFTSGDTTPSVLDNDTLNGPLVNPTDVIVTPVTVPGGLTLNPDGTITVAPGTPSDTYTVVYQICEIAIPTNCDIATATLVIFNPIDAVNDDYSATPLTSGDTTPSVIVNDTLDGNPAVIGTNPGEVTLTGVTVPAELTLNPDGTITVNPNTPSGTYTVVYEICENGAVPANCDQATATVVVENPIDAVNDDYSATPLTSGDTTPSVIINDTLDGNPAVIGTNPGEVTLTGVTVPAELTLNPDGTITVNPNTPSGTYTVVYEICEVGANPANCDQATATVVVLNPIDAVNDDYSATPLTSGDTTPSVIVNDTLDGNPAVIGTNPGEVTLTGVTVPTELTLNPDGTITVNPNTPSGTYTVVYEICEVGASPANCDQATATVVVLNPIDAVNDDYSATPLTSGDTTPSVIINDTLDGNPVVIGTNPGEVTLTGVTVPAELTLNPDGTITVNPNTPSGTYTVVYEICEVGASPANCDQATATVVVLNPIDAVNDDYSVTPLTSGDTTPSVIVNDTLDGNPAVIGTNPGEVTLTGVTVPTELTLNPDGTITVNPNTPSGTYTVVYEICEVGANPANCDQATATVVVLNPIDAVNDDYSATPLTSGDTTPSVIINDTLDGNPAVIGTNPGEVTLTGVTVPTELTLNPDGTITVNPNTPSGTYTVVYEICEVGANPANCDQATATVVVLNPIDAVNDDYSATPLTSGDTTPSVIVNDTLDGNPAVIGTNPGEVTLTGVTVPTELTLNPDGTITVNPNTPSGTYTVVYEICEVGASPANCDQATATVVVLNPIDAVDDDYSVTPLTSGDTTPSVIVNDTLDGNPAVIGTNPGEVTLTGVTVPTELTLNPDGTITVNPNTPSGTYTVVYEICEVGAVPANCDQATATIVVLNPIDAVNDDYSATPLTSGDTTPSVIVNDTLDGNPVVIGTNPGEVTLSGVTVPTELTLNPDGTITVNPNTPSGTYTVVYEICEVGASPANCDQATATVVVLNPIDAVNDDYSATPLTSGDTTPSVIVNDTLDGNPAVIGTNPGEVTLTGVTVPTELTLNPDGTITVNPNTPSGTYTVVYEICEVGASPANCDQATATVVVLNPIDAVNDDYSATPLTSGDTTPSVIINDTLDGNPVVIGTNPGEVTLTGVTVPAELTLNPDGTITVNPNTPSGTYTVVYEICEVGANPANCDQATATIVVLNPIDAVNDDYSATPLTSGDTTPSVIVNDTLDGNPAVIGTNPGEVTLTGVTVPTGLTLNPDGTITVNPNTPSGTYTVVYEICEVGAVPANCDQATATIVVLNPIDAVNDDYSATPLTSGDTTPSVIVNDTLDGNPVVIGTNPGEVTLTGVTVPTGLTLNPDGTITVNPNTPSGTYTVVYEICEVGANPANCDQATATIVVFNPIVANDDDNIATPVNGYEGGIAIPTVLINDTLDGSATNTPLVTITLTSALPTGILFDTTTGSVTVAPGTPAGTYTFTYDLCETGANPANCDPATVTIIVTAPPIIAEDDDLSSTPINGFDGGIPGNIFDNNGNGEDTLNLLPVIQDEVTITILDNDGLTGLVIDDNGDVIVPAGTPMGTYTVVYQICDVLNPTNCDTAEIIIVVEAPVIDAVDNDFTSTPINSATGGTVSIFNNDTLNNDPIDPADVTVTIIDFGGVNGAQVDVNGNVTIPAGTPPGTYVLTYQVCQVLNPTVCDIATITILVLDPCDFDDAPDSCDVIVYNTISNNNDGINDYFILEGIERFPNNTVEIYNRWGVLVYDVEGYDNDARVFRGISEGRSTIKQDSELPEGTYFYVLKYTKSNGVVKERAGYLYINRQ